MYLCFIFTKIYENLVYFRHYPTCFKIITTM